MKENVFLVIASLLSIILFISCDNKSEKKNDDGERIIFVNSAEDIGTKGKGHYINTNKEYRDRDGVRWSKDNIWAPGPNESLNDASHNEKMRAFEGSGQEDQYEEGYKDGYNAAKSELED